MHEITSVLDAANEPGSANRLTLDDVKRWLAEYLDSCQEEIARFPEQEGQPHWDLLAPDYDPERDAVFVLAYFGDGSVTILGGRGSMPAIRDFAECSFPSEPNDVLEEVFSRFTVRGRALLTLVDLTHWLANA